jgi:hypothetical protein
MSIETSVDEKCTLAIGHDNALDADEHHHFVRVPGGLVFDAGAASS